MDFGRSRLLQQKSHSLIPGGAHTYAKGDDQYPVNAPGFIARGKGCRVWDVDGNEFIEYGMGLRSVILGHGYEPLIEAAIRQMRLGENFTRPASIELEAAERFLDMIPTGEMVKFAKNGSDATTAAVKIARAVTGREKVAICAEQPFFSTDDWFIGSTVMAAGIPHAVRQMSLKFHYNDLETVQALFDEHPDEIACLIMEAETTEPPRPGFLYEVQRLCHENGALFILDEMITGFRWHNSGAQHLYGITPDLSTFGKAMANGIALSALTGKREYMELGGITHNRERVFLLSTTHGAENHALAAMIETINVYQREPVVETLYRQGERLRQGIDQAAQALGLQEYFQVVGRACNLIYVTKDQNRQRSQPFRTLFMQELISRGVLGPSFVVSYAHRDEDIDQSIEAVAGALVVYRNALDEGVEKYLVGRSVKPVFRQFN